MKNIFIIILLLVTATNYSLSQDTPVNWIHGWGDDANIWRHYGPIFQQARRLQSRTPVYSDNDNNGVQAATTTIAGRIVRNTDNILIGHSMGGLVAREYERINGPTAVRGIVTVASPNQGATVANQIISGNAQAVILRGQNDMSAGPVGEGFAALGLFATGITGIPPFLTQRLASKSIPLFVQEDLFPSVNAMIDRMAGSATIHDFRVNGPYINGLNNYSARVPVANIICEENNNAALRVANGMISPPENAPFHQYDDSHLINYVDQLRQIYKGFRIYHDVQKIAQPWRYSHHNSLANKWHQGENYMGSVYQADYNTLIGATRTVPVTSTVLVLVCNDNCTGPFPDPGRIDCPIPSEDDCHYEYQTITTWQVVTTLSDGLLPSWTQRIPNIASQNVYTALGVNHAEVGNHPEISRAYNLVFEREDGLRVPLR